MMERADGDWKNGAVALCCCALLSLGCESRPSDSGASQSKQIEVPKPSTPQGHGKVESEDSIEWSKPDGWRELAPRMMRKATYQTGGKGGPAEVAVFHFGPGQGGGVEANVERWVGQFKDVSGEGVQRDQMQVGGYQIATVRIVSGTFSSGMPGGPARPMENFGLRAAVVETPMGAYFFKMTGPSQTVEEQGDNFQALLQSIKTKA